MELTNTLKYYFPNYAGWDPLWEFVEEIQSLSGKIVGLNKWVTALRSGKYIQGYSALHTDFGGEIQDCCLSVYGQEVWGCTSKNDYTRDLLTPAGVTLRGILRTHDRHFYLPIELQVLLSAVNDNGCTYEQIAHFLESEFQEA